MTLHTSCLTCMIEDELPQIDPLMAQGSAEAVRDAVQALSSEAVGVKVIAMGVGPVSAFDVMEASAVGADIIAFNVRTAGAEVDTAIKQAHVDVLTHRVIYSLLDEVSHIPPPLFLPCINAGCLRSVSSAEITASKGTSPGQLRSPRPLY